MGDNEVVPAPARVVSAEREGVGVMCRQAILGEFATVAEQGKHRRTGVDGIGCKEGICGKQAGEKATIAIAEDECMRAVGESRDEVGTGSVRVRGLA